MAFDIDAELQKTFEEAVRSYEQANGSDANSLRTAEDWKKLRQIKEATQDRIDMANRQYDADYHMRVASVRKRLIDEVGRPIHDLPVPVGRDRFNKDAINRQAHTEVRGEHEALIAHIRDSEKTQISALQKDARQRDRLFGKAEADFNMVTDRRGGFDRRTPSRSR